MFDAVGDFPGLHRVGGVSHAKGEAIEIRAVEKFNVVRRSKFDPVRRQEPANATARQSAATIFK